MANRPKKYMTKALRTKLSTRAARLLGRMGGLRRTQTLTAEERRAIAVKASQASAKVRSEKAAARNKAAQARRAKARTEK